jgi:hypothetical protein
MQSGSSSATAVVLSAVLDCVNSLCEDVTAAVDTSHTTLPLVSCYLLPCFDAYAVTILQYCHRQCGLCQYDSSALSLQLIYKHRRFANGSFVNVLNRVCTPCTAG